MKRNFAIIFLLISVTGSIGQTNTVTNNTTKPNLVKTTFLTVTPQLGINIPMGTWKENNYDGYGNATMGGAITIPLEVYFNDHFALSFMARQQFNGFNTKPLAQILADIDNVSYAVDSDGWKITSLFVGIKSGTYLDKKRIAFLYGRTMFGAGLAFTPNIKIYYPNNSDDYIKYATKADGSWSGLMGAGLSFLIDDSFRLNIETSYTASSYSFKDIEVKDRNDFVYYKFNMKEEINSFSLSVGVEIPID